MRKAAKFIVIVLILSVIALLIFLGVSKKAAKEEATEPIVYGDIDLDAEVVSPAKPEAGEASGNTVGNTYINLLNDGLFCETDEYFYFVVKYDSEKYLIRRNKSDDDTVRVYQGDIRNIFVCNGWLYGIVNDEIGEFMVAMDLDGNNQYISSEYMNNVRTMQSDGSRIYFTVDQRNVTGLTLCTSICQCNMDLTEEEAIKTVNNELSQVDIIAIKDGNVYFSETYGGKEANIFKPVKSLKEEYPILYDGNEVVLNSSVCSLITGDKVTFNCLNTYGGCAYISATSSDKNYLITYNLETGESSFEEVEDKIDHIFEYSEGIVVFSNGMYNRIPIE